MRESVGRFLLAFTVTLGLGTGYFTASTGEIGGEEAQACDIPSDCVNSPAKWQLLSRDPCVDCDFGGCNCT